MFDEANTGSAQDMLRTLHAGGREASHGARQGRSGSHAHAVWLGSCTPPLAVTTDGLPLGLAAVKFWSRQKFKGTNALKRKVNPTRVPIEQKESFRWLENLRQSASLFAAPDRCVHVGDRESDIYELFSLAHDLGTHFIVRSCVVITQGVFFCARVFPAPPLSLELGF